jgi:hypothetical protein
MILCCREKPLASYAPPAPAAEPWIGVDFARPGDDLTVEMEVKKPTAQPGSSVQGDALASARKNSVRDAFCVVARASLSSKQRDALSTLLLAAIAAHQAQGGGNG